MFTGSPASTFTRSKDSCDKEALRFWALLPSLYSFAGVVDFEGEERELEVLPSLDSLRGLDDAVGVGAQGCSTIS